MVDRAGYAVAIIDESLLEGEFEQDAVIDVFGCGFLPDLLGRKVVGTGVHQESYSRLFEGAIQILPIEENPLPLFYGLAIKGHVSIPHTLLDADEEIWEAVSQCFETTGGCLACRIGDQRTAQQQSVVAKGCLQGFDAAAIYMGAEARLG